MKRTLLLLLILTSFPFRSHAQEAKPLAEDPELEKRVMALSQELRCLVCQNETLADSRVDLAVDLRRQIREQMKAGKSDKEIVAFLTDRYGDFVLYKPPVKPQTYLLWYGPFVLMAFGIFLLYRFISQRRETIKDTPLSDAEKRRAAELLKDASGKEVA